MLGIFQGVLAILLLVAAAWDIRKRRIPNRLTAMVLLVGIAGAWYFDNGWRALSGLGAMVLVIVLGYFPWMAGKVGGGDVKLGAAAAVIPGMARLPEYLLATALAGAGVAVVCYGLSSRKVRGEIAFNLKSAAVGVMPEPALRSGGGRVSVPYGVAFVAAALWILFVRKGG